MKNNNLIIFFAFALMMTSNLYAQSDVVPMGGTATSEGGTITFTIGQIAVQSYCEGSTSISEGVQHPYEIQTIGIDNYPGITLNAVVYPNPTVGNVQLTMYNVQLEGEVKVFDMNGKQLLSKKIERSTTEITMSDLVAGTYFVSVVSGTQVLKTFKVIKVVR